jgi:predicted Rossmann fold flavoprotein
MTTSDHFDLIVIGGGAGGFFGAIQTAEFNPKLRILILEKSNTLLGKVKISGGGRCNVTHACYDPAELVLKYPRGGKELLGPFHQFMCGDMIGWLDDHGVPTKTEMDGRVFPSSNTSSAIIDCFFRLCDQYRIEIRTQDPLLQMTKEKTCWVLHTKNELYKTKSVLIATGSSKQSWKMLNAIGHTIVSPAPSLFTFNVNDSLTDGLAGISFPDVNISVDSLSLNTEGPLLITHWGLSGPAILKMSAWGARLLHQCNYNFSLKVNWVGQSHQVVMNKLDEFKKTMGNAKIHKTNFFSLPKRFYMRLLSLLSLEKKNWAEASKKELTELTEYLTRYQMQVQGKSTFKEEFVTSGGIELKEVNFKTMESKILPGVYFAGEVLDIDAVTGGFNFQAAWTTAYLAGKHIGTLASSEY